MISSTLHAALNEQIAAEIYSSYLYLSLSIDFDHKNLGGFGHWFKCQSIEETSHAQKIIDWLLIEKAKPVLKDVKAPKENWKAPIYALKIAVNHEKLITERIKNIMSLARAESDFGVEGLMSWFIAEQIEEESTVGKIHDKLDLIGGDPNGLIFMDKLLAER